MILLKRFRFNGGGSKITRNVSFPMDELDMRPFLIDGAEPAAGTTFKLVSMVKHLGSVSGGHYVAYGRHPSAGAWYEFDDSYVTAVRPEQVAAEQAYVLVYQRTLDREAAASRARLIALSGSTSGLNRDAGLAPLVSRRWLALLASSAHPGPIANYDFGCPHGRVYPHIAGRVHEFAARVPIAAWRALKCAHGGGFFGLPLLPP